MGQQIEDAVAAHRITALCVVGSGETVVAVGPRHFRPTSSTPFSDDDFFHR
jgi:hypothetical protein